MATNLEKMSFKTDIKRINKLSQTIGLLNKINDKMCMRFTKDNVLFYSVTIASEDAYGQGSIVAMKYNTFKTSEFFDVEEQLDEIQLDFIMPIISGKKLISNLSFLSEESIKVNIKYKKHTDDTGTDVNFITHTAITDGRFKANISSAEINKISIISQDMIMKVVDPKNKQWEFQLGIKDLKDIKNAMKLEDDRDEPLSIVVKSNTLLFSQPTWDLKIGKTKEDIEDSSISLKQGFFKSVSEKYDNITIGVYPTFIVCGDLEDGLVLAYEQHY